MNHFPILANLRFLAAIGIVGIFLHAAAPAALAQDADNDGIPDASDPCAADPLNACFGPVAVDNTALTDIRLNAGPTCATAFTDCRGESWAVDFGFNLAATATACNLPNSCATDATAVFGCTDAASEGLFKCEHWDALAVPELSYSFDVPDGDYMVNLLFMNSWTGSTTVGSRVFDIVIEGATAYAAFDQVDAAGGVCDPNVLPCNPVVRAAVATVSDGNGLQIEFIHGVENPAIKGIEVLAEPPCVTDPDCDDSNACTDDTCNAGFCDNAPNTDACDDGVACTTGDVCSGGSCAGTPNDGLCDDATVCTIDVCNPATGCENTPTIDTDLDGICDADDNCPDDANAGQEDLGDGDGVGDACDNCPATSNPGQGDADMDTQGDACDVCPSDGLDDDEDGDGICPRAGFNPPATGDQDNCAAAVNPGQEDPDADGRGSACDVCPNQTGAAEDTCLGTGLWETRASSAIGRHECGLVAVDGLLYVLGSEESNVLEIYDPATDTYTTGPAIPGGNLHHIQPVVIGSKIYIPGGLFGFPGPSTSALLMLDTQNLGAGWQNLAPMPTSRGALGCAVEGAKIYCAGGLSITAGNTAIDVMEVYNSITDEWSVLSPMPRVRDHFQAEIIDGKFYAVAGRDTTIGATFAFNDVYDIATDTWSTAAPLPTARGGYASEVLQGRLLVIGGEGGGPSSGTFPEVEEYDPLRDSWRTLASMITPRHGVSAAISTAEDGITEKLYTITGGPVQGASSSTINEVFTFDLGIDGDSDGFSPPVDCNDNDDTVFPGAPEVCNGVDENCDGTADDGNPGGGASCGVSDVGECALGTLTCTAGTLICAGNIEPAIEICNGLDDDCDGVVDNGNPGGGAVCGTSDVGECQLGVEACVAGAISCVGNIEPAAEACNGLDDDCDGTADEGNPDSGASCSTGVPGVCAAGTEQCVSGAIACVEDTSASAEVCDGLDNDCDGSVDESTGGAACSTGDLGVCAAGTQVCNSGNLVCTADSAPTPETCNGLDDDCDGETDENNPGGGISCSTGLPGVCADGLTECQAGLIQCVADGGSTEICDGLDNDCDGAVDNGNPGGGAACSDTGQPGICSAGTEQCVGGAIDCVADVAPGIELCGSGEDEDCDGATDEPEDCVLCLAENTIPLSTMTKRNKIKLVTSPVRDKFIAKGTFFQPSANFSQPDEGDVIIRVTDELGVFYEALLPAGTVAETKPGRKYQYKDSTRPFENDGVRQIKMSLKSDLVTTKYKIKSQEIDLPAFTGTASVMTIKIGDTCYVDPVDSCTASSSGTTVKCQ